MIVGGYVACPVIGVPTSVGYGAAFGGMLLSICCSRREGYRFTISMSGGAAYRVVVYRNLQGEMSVSSLDRLS